MKVNVKPLSNNVVFFSLTLFFLFEFPVRIMLQPDPWLLHPLHWYFEQPLRITIEAMIVVFLMASLFKAHRNLLKISRNDIPLLMIAVVATAVLFGSLEFEQLKESLNTSLSNIFIWCLTGLFIGIGQELIYRGFLYTSLTRLVSHSAAAFTTTFLFVFAPLHSIRMWDLFLKGEYGVVLILVAIFFSAGFFFQWLRDKSQNIIVPGITHGVGNAITWLAVFG